MVTVNIGVMVGFGIVMLIIGGMLGMIFMSILQMSDDDKEE